MISTSRSDPYSADSAAGRNLSITTALGEASSIGEAVFYTSSIPILRVVFNLSAIPRKTMNNKRAAGIYKQIP
jgi:hypothetical protein